MLEIPGGRNISSTFFPILPGLRQGKRGSYCSLGKRSTSNTLGEPQDPQQDSGCNPRWKTFRPHLVREHSGKLSGTTWILSMLLESCFGQKDVEIGSQEETKSSSREHKGSGYEMHILSIIPRG